MRSPSAGSGTAARTDGSVTFPLRSSTSVTMPTLRSRWASTAMCCQSQPPHPSATFGQGGSTRCGDGSRTATTVPRANVGFSSSSSTSTVSSGSAPATNTTRPPSSRATASPPTAIAVVRSSTVVTGALYRSAPGP